MDPAIVRTAGELSLRSPEPGDLGWVVSAHGAFYAREHGWDATFEAMVAGLVADYVAHHDPARDRCWIAVANSVRVGSVFCVHEDADTARLRMLVVDPDARGRGIGATLVAECVRFARSAGYRRIVLLTTDDLAAARRIYERAGFTIDRVERVRQFGHEVNEQHWSMDL